jgi:hypothetical protein
MYFISVFCDPVLEEFPNLANIFLSSFTGNPVCEPNSDLLQKYKKMSNYEKEHLFSFTLYILRNACVNMAKHQTKRPK